MLHIIDQFPVSQASLEKTATGDTILFTENAVYAIKQSENNTLTQKTFAHINLCVRKADLLIRNISISELFKGVAVLDDLDYQLIQGQESVIRSWN